MKDATNDDEAQAETESSMLLSAREAMGLSQDDVAKELYLTSSFIRYIDENDLNKLPRAFVRGYLRSYAKLVKIDGDAVVRQYETTSNAVSPESIEIRRVTNQPVGSVNFTGPVFKTGVIGLSALLLVV